MYQHHPENARTQLTSGFHLRPVREIRKVSLSELSRLTGVSEAKIELAENDTERLNLDEIEKIAIALDCHPSHLAFPNWDSYPYKPIACDLEGKLTLNGVLQSKKLRVKLDREFGLSIRDANSTGRSIKIRTFNGAMSTKDFCLRGQRRTAYKISGNCLGYYSDCYGQLSEIECDQRILKSLDICICYTRDGISYGFSGYASAADGNVKNGRPSPAGDWEFVAEFLVPTKLVGQFCGLYPGPEASLQRELSNLDGPSL